MSFAFWQHVVFVGERVSFCFTCRVKPEPRARRVMWSCHVILSCDFLCVMFQANVHYSSTPTGRESSPSSVSVNPHHPYPNTTTPSITPTPPTSPLPQHHPHHPYPITPTPPPPPPPSATMGVSRTITNFITSISTSLSPHPISC